MTDQITNPTDTTEEQTAFNGDTALLHGQLMQDLAEWRYVQEQIEALQAQADEIRLRAEAKALDLYWSSDNAIVAPGVTVSRRLKPTFTQADAFAWVMESPIERGNLLQINPERMSFLIGLMFNDTRLHAAFEVNEAAYARAWRSRQELVERGSIEANDIPVQTSAQTLTVSFTKKDMSAIDPRPPADAYIVARARLAGDSNQRDLSKWLAKVTPNGLESDAIETVEVVPYSNERDENGVPLDPTHPEHPNRSPF